MSGRCIESSWRAKAHAPYGPERKNRCTRRILHPGYHLDELGNVFITNPFKIIRQEGVQLDNDFVCSECSRVIHQTTLFSIFRREYRGRHLYQMVHQSCADKVRMEKAWKHILTVRLPR